MGHLIRVLDIETTGMEPPAEIIEIGWQDVLVGDDGVSFGERASLLFQAEHPIPPETMAVHHIQPAMLEGQPYCVPDLMRLIVLKNDPAVIVAHNAEFEGKWFTPEILGPTPLLCTYKAALRVWPDAPSHGNQALMYWLGLHAGMDEAVRHPPHRAGPDAYVTAHILKALLAAGATGKEMVAWTKEPRMLPTCPIGEWRGKKWAEVDAGFLRWMINKPVEADLVWNARRELDRRSDKELVRAERGAR